MKKMYILTLLLLASLSFSVSIPTISQNPSYPHSAALNLLMRWNSLFHQEPTVVLTDPLAGLTEQIAASQPIGKGGTIIGGGKGTGVTPTEVSEILVLTYPPKYFHDEAAVLARTLAKRNDGMGAIVVKEK